MPRRRVATAPRRPAASRRRRDARRGRTRSLSRLGFEGIRRHSEVVERRTGATGWSVDDVVVGCDAGCGNCRLRRRSWYVVARLFNFCCCNDFVRHGTCQQPYGKRRAAYKFLFTFSSNRGSICRLDFTFRDIDDVTEVFFCLNNILVTHF